MKVETTYEVGQEFWTIQGGKATRHEVVEIFVTVKADGVQTRLKDETSPYALHMEEDCYRSKEEMKKTIFPDDEDV